jgi:hypothetical protein
MYAMTFPNRSHRRAGAKLAHRLVNDRALVQQSIQGGFNLIDAPVRDPSPGSDRNAPS